MILPVKDLKVSKEAYILPLFISSLIALFGGLHHEYWFIWIGGLLAALLFLFLAYPHVWMYGFWLAGIYGLVGGSVICLYSLGRINGWYRGLGVMGEVLAIYITYVLLRKTLILRDNLKEGNSSYLGLWSVSLLLFYVLSNLSFIAWFWWGMEIYPIHYYTAAEVVLILLALHILYIPEHFEWEPLLHAVVLEENVCPHCGGTLQTERRKCPKCGEYNVIKYCPASEEFMVVCKNCKKLTPLGRERCIHCNSIQLAALKCTVCGKTAPINEWRP